MKAAFMFLAPGANPETHTSIIKTEKMELVTVGVPDYKTACKKAIDLINNGISAIELCGGFGIEGTSKIKTAVNGKIPVGVVRFDFHPGLGYKSGDELF
ncbi:DUF6506 family protein [Clostridium sp. LBM24168]